MATRYKSIEYISWDNMQQRCTNPKHPRYKDYGARGIQVCACWGSFANFLADMGKKPSVEYTIERIDNNGDYTPDNCKWIPKENQGRNKRKYSNNSSGITGVIYSKTQGLWRVKIQGEFVYNGKDFFEACCRRKSWEAAQKRSGA